MTTPILSAFYFGSVEHYRLFALHPKVIIDTGEHYERQSYRTRTSIVGPNGVQDLVVPIDRRSGEKMPMRTVGPSYVERWPQRHVHAIRSAYGNAPWFIHYIDEIEAVVMKKYERLVDLDIATMRLGMKWLGLGTDIQLSGEFIVPDPLSDVPSRTMTADSGSGSTISNNQQRWDLRSSLHPKKSLPLDLRPTPQYPQIFVDRHGFQARMSVIDLVMNTGNGARGFLLH